MLCQSEPVSLSEPLNAANLCRFLADLANKFHDGGKISFLELVSGVQCVEDVPQAEFTACSRQAIRASKFIKLSSQVIS